MGLNILIRMCQVEVKEGRKEGREGKEKREEGREGERKEKGGRKGG